MEHTRMMPEHARIMPGSNAAHGARWTQMQPLKKLHRPCMGSMGFKLKSNGCNEAQVRSKWGLLRLKSNPFVPKGGPGDSLEDHRATCFAPFFWGAKKQITRFACIFDNFRAQKNVAKNVAPVILQSIA